jgi:hypothetical protein
MPAFSSPPPFGPEPSGSQPGGAPWPGWGNPNMRISDAERQTVADRLAVHYGDGRLDQDEFNRRLDQTMSATTQADLDGLFADLPDLQPGGGQAGPPPEPPMPPPPPPVVGQPPRRLPSKALAVLLVIVVAIAVGHALTGLVPWVALALIAILWLWYRPLRRR